MWIARVINVFGHAKFKEGDFVVIKKSTKSWISSMNRDAVSTSGLEFQGKTCYHWADTSVRKPTRAEMVQARLEGVIL